MPSSRRISAIAARPVCSIVVSTSRVCGRSSPSARRSAPACTTMIAEAVGDDVVQLAGDPRALLGDGEPRRLLALVLELDRAGGERRGQLVAAAHDGGRAPDREQDAADEQRVADRVLADRERHHDHRDRDHGGGDPAVAAIRVRAARVGRQQQPGERHAQVVHRVPAGVRDADDDEHGDEHEQRRRAAPGDRNASCRARARPRPATARRRPWSRAPRRSPRPGAGARGRCR